MQPVAPSFEDIVAAADRLQGHAVRTPLIRNQVLDAVSGASVFVKPECLQRTGSFKFRGAYNAVSQLDAEQRREGVVASSSGNHAQGIAAACALFDTPATIIMPSDAPRLKVERTKGHGASIVFYDRETEDREGRVAEYRKENGGVFIHPFNHPHVVAGQGTTGLEMVEQAREYGSHLDRVLICTGGGGLTAGITLAVKQAFPDARIHTVEPEGFDDYRRSLESGSIVTNTETAGSICDAILTPAPGPMAFDLTRDLLSEGIVISDDEAREAVRFAFSELKLVVEPGGAAALAGLLQAGKRWQGETIGIVLSGGNVDPEHFAEIVG